jgi:hypothetical protein
VAGKRGAGRKGKQKSKGKKQNYKAKSKKGGLLGRKWSIPPLADKCGKKLGELGFLSQPLGRGKRGGEPNDY